LVAHLLEIGFVLKPRQLIPMFQDESFNSNQTVFQVFVREIEIPTKRTKEFEFFFLHLPVGPKRQRGDLQEKFLKYPGVFSRKIHLFDQNPLVEYSLRLFAFVGRKVCSRKEQIKQDRKSTRLNSSHVKISYAVFCLKKKNNFI